MPQQLHQQRNGRRTDPLDDFESHHVQVFMPRVEEAFQQRHRTQRSLDQGGFGGGADLRVVGLQTICPFAYKSRISGKARRRRGQCDCESATAWMRPTATISARARFFMNAAHLPFSICCVSSAVD